MKNTNIKLEKNFISVVVYIHNHEKYIKEFIERVTRVLENNFEHSEMIFVNDCSSDNSVAEIKKAFISDRIACTIINLSNEHQVERAMVAGQDVAIGDFVYEFDTPLMDYSDEEIMNLYTTCLKGFDVVSAAAENKGKYTSKLFYKIFEAYSKNNITLHSERFRILSRRGINRIKNISQTIPYRKAIYFNCGLKAKCISYKPINDISRELNTTKTGERMDFAIDNLLFFTNIGWKISSFMSLVMILFSVAIGIYTLANWIGNQNVALGWTTIMMFLAICFSGLFVLLTIGIKYLSLILFVNTNKQDYVFESVEKVK